MARIFTEGIEFGDLLAFDVVSNASFVLASGATVHTGAYALSITVTGAYTAKNVTADDELWFKFFFRYSVAAVSDTRLFAWFKGSTELGSIRHSNVANKLTAYTSTGTLVATGSKSLLNNTWYLVEVHVKIADAGGAIDVKVDSVSDIAFSGDTKPGADTQIDQARFMGTNTGNTLFDDIAFDDAAYPGDGRIVSKKPNGNGASSQWVGQDGDSVDNYLNVDEVPVDGDTTYNQTTVSTDTDLYALENASTAPAIPSGATIVAVYPEARFRDTAGGGEQAYLPIYIGATQYDGTAFTATSSYSCVKGDYRVVNPNSTIAWTATDIDNLQVGVKKL